MWLDMADRVGHLLVVGATRVGKSRLLELTLAQDVRRGGNVVLLFDPKGDAGLMKRAFAEAQRAGRPFYLFHLGFPEISARYNPIGDFTRVTEVATRIANNLPSEGQSAAFPGFRLALRQCDRAHQRRPGRQAFLPQHLPPRHAYRSAAHPLLRAPARQPPRVRRLA